MLRYNINNQVNRFLNTSGLTSQRARPILVFGIYHSENSKKIRILEGMSREVRRPVIAVSVPMPFREACKGLMKQPDKPPSVFPLRLPTTTRAQANELASLDGVSLNQFITQAVAEKIARLQAAFEGTSPARLDMDHKGVAH